MLVLAIAQAALAGFIALVGAFADGGDIWSRLLLILVHPLCAAGLLRLVLLPRPATAIVLAIAALLVVNVGADLFAALMIARGAVRGDWVTSRDILRDSGHRGRLRTDPGQDATPARRRLAPPRV